MIFKPANLTSLYQLIKSGFPLPHLMCNLIPIQNSLKECLFLPKHYILTNMLH